MTPTPAAHTVRLGTRGSALALAQSRLVARLVEALVPGTDVLEFIIRSDGDRATEAPLHRPERQGFFTAELTRALLDGEVDLVVHSLKDLPVAPTPGSAVVAILERRDPGDALVSRGGGGIDALARGARVGTSSTRRAAQLGAVRRDVVAVPIRGNVDTRVGKVDSGEYDAVILAAAGLRRLGMEDRISANLDEDDFLPAPGQGALAIECRSDDGPTTALLARLDDATVRAEVEAERSFLAGLGGGCSLPIGALGRVGQDGLLHLRGGIWPTTGESAVRLDASGPVEDAREMGRQMALEAVARGAAVNLSTALDPEGGHR